MKRKKVTRQRAGKTHGWGSKKKHRGAGNRGGRGNAGSGKRADQKKPSYWNAAKPMKAGQKRGQEYFGKYGFGMNKRTELNTITLRVLAQSLPMWATEKQVTVAGGVYTADLVKLGYGKILGTGSFDVKAKITVAAATPGAIEKITAAGGSVDVLATPAHKVRTKNKTLAEKNAAKAAKNAVVDAARVEKAPKAPKTEKPAKEAKPKAPAKKADTE